MPDLNGDGVINLDDVKKLLNNNNNGELTTLKGDGDFRSQECVELLKQADFVITNPPFSLFREYVAQLVKYGKQFLIIGNMNAITYKEIFPLIKENKMWLGPTISSGDRMFNVPKDYPLEAAGCGYDENGRPFIRVKGVRWFTNIDHGCRHQPLPLMTLADNLKFSKHKEIRGKSAYDRYDNYNAIEVPYTDALPADYAGVMGVPISFLDKYSPEQFEIVGITENNEANKRLWLEYGKHDRPYLNGQRMYSRLLIKHKKAEKQ